MRLVFLLFVVFLVSADAKFSLKLGDLFGKISSEISKLDIPSIAQKIIRGLQPRKPSTEKSPGFCGDHDCPNFYEIKLDASDYKLRCYPKPYKWVSTTYQGMNRRQAFWRLFNYIQGNNEKKMKIKMTVPVTMQMAPGKTPSSLSEDNRIMSFFIPFKHQKDAPAPSADDVRLTYVEPFCAYVMVYGGWSNKWKVQRNYKALVAALKRDGLGEDFRTDAVYSAGYDGPSKIFNRHNEIWLVSKKHSPESTPQPEVETVEPSTEPPAVDSPKFCDGHDCPYFYEKELNVSDRDYTLRCYPKPYKWVSTTFEGMNKGQAFWRLFKYIQGNNEKEMKIKMTVPVTMQIQPGKIPGSLSQDNRIMSFFIPFKHQKDAPAPSADDVRLTYGEPFCAYVMVYGGWSSTWKVQRNYKALVAALKRDGLGDDFRTDVVYSAAYDDPKKVFNRHNEIWLVSKKHSPDMSAPLKSWSKVPDQVSSPQPEVGTVEPSTEPSAVDSPKLCDGHDCPYFYEKELNISDKNYTLRCYPKPYKWVSTTVEGMSSREAGETAFWRLFGYIQGRNAQKMKIKMTVPVTTEMQLDKAPDSFCKENYTMSFFVPFKHQKDAPAPSEDDVHLTNVEPFCAYVMVYGGWSNMEKVEENYKALVGALKRDGLGNDIPTDIFYTAGYDSPMKVRNRHNEIWLISKKYRPVNALL